MTMEHGRRCLASLASGEMQMKTIIRHHLTLSRKAIIFLKRKIQVLARMQSNWNPHTLPMGISSGVPAVEINLQFFRKLNIELPCEPAIPHLSIHPKKMKTCLHKTHMQIFIVALLIKDKKQQLLKCSCSGLLLFC